ncbi:4-aminobutyrate aminotransferase GabT [Pluralibacter gergoviae]|nr:4-aminobutyrate aminotransferase GabT [Pluralibacter gergoviae]
MNNAELNQRRLQATPRGVGVMCDYYAQKAENATLWDIEGNEVIDFAAGIAVLNTGHRHPKVIAAIEAQLKAFTHHRLPDCSLRELRYPGRAHQRPGADRRPGENHLLHHRRRSRRERSEDCPRLYPPSRHHHLRRRLPRPHLHDHGADRQSGAVQDWLRSVPGFGLSRYLSERGHGVTTDEALNSLERIFKADIAPDQVAAIVVEPVQGEGGFNVAPPAFMQGLRALCDTHGILLVADEVQTGFARTGKLFAMQHYDVKPDLMTMAKSLAGGMPLSGVVGRAEVMDAPAPGGLGGTYAGNPLAVAAAHAVLDVIEEEQLCQRANQLGQHLKEVLEHARQSCPAIADIRGQGSMVAVEFNDPATGKPSAEFMKQVQDKAKQERAAAAELRRLRQRDSLPLSADHSRRAVHQSAGYSGARTEGLIPP